MRMESPLTPGHSLLTIPKPRQGTQAWAHPWPSALVPLQQLCLLAPDGAGLTPEADRRVLGDGL